MRVPKKPSSLTNNLSGLGVGKALNVMFEVMGVLDVIPVSTSGRACFPRP